MKKINTYFIACIALLSAVTAVAQDEDNKWAITVGVNAIDLYPVGEDAPQGAFASELFNSEDHWNFIPAPSRVQLGYYVGDGIVVTGAGSINNIDKVGDARVDDLSYYALDGGIQYSLKNAIWEEGFIDPYLGVGGGYAWLDDEGFGTANGTAGVDFNLSDNVSLNVQTMYKHAFEDENPKHWQHSFGIKFVWGAVDTDGDGIVDNKDKCPNTPGLEKFMGCPDTDNDGIQDSEDMCPNSFGPAETMGCPDSDGDTVLDKDDKCPNEAGPVYNMGCPDLDSDGDGILDSKDGCVNEAGPASNNGCPLKDTDGDGIVDDEDKCPNEAGIAELDGCPRPVAPTVKEQAQLNAYAKTILFDTGKSSIKAESARVLQDITDILNKYPESKFSVDGHTDSVGSGKLNQRLSDSRANSVKNYLVKNGINEFRLSAVGYGEDKPIASNSTKAGRAQNRRVEINLVK